MMTQQRTTSTFAEALNQRGVAPFQFILVGLLLLVLVIDGIDIQLLSLVAPAIIAEWQVARSDFGPALAGALVGMSIGALIGGALGDRLGRLPLLVGSTLLFGAATVLAGLTDGVAGMTALRILSGLGFGAAAPNAIALAVDWLPERSRSLTTSLMSIGTPAGGMIGATLVVAVLPSLGWRGTFYACGILTIAIAVGILLAVRESPSWLAAKGRPEQARRIADSTLGIEWNPPAKAAVDAARAETPHASFLARPLLRLNIGAGLGFFCISFASYALVVWTAIMLTSLDFSMNEAVGAVFAFNVAAVLAAIFAGVLMSRFGTRATLAGASALLMTCVLALLLALDGDLAGAQTRTATYLLVGGAGGFAGAAMAAIYAMMAHGYPVACRSGGLGFGMMLGRAGGIVASFSGGYLLDMQGTATWPFLVSLAVAAAVGIGCAFLSDAHVPAAMSLRRTQATQ